MKLIGRAHQVQHLLGLLEDDSVRLVNLTGPAGVGKTRLAQEVITRLQSTTSTHSVTFASLSHANLLAVRLAKSFDIAPVGAESWEARVIDHLRDKHMVLLLDNLEHLLPLPFLPRLLAACPRIQLLTTSRVVLHLSDEHMLRVPPLAVPPQDEPPEPEALRQYESVQLLVSRASRAAPEFDVHEANARDIATLVRSLDGLPLALELAAARLNTFAPRDLCERLNDRMSLLVGGPVDRPMHQRTLRGTIAWSYDLLATDVQRLFRRLSVLTGSVTPEMALAVCGEPTDTLESLLELGDCSLIQLQSGERFSCSMLESMRIFALEALVESGEEHLIRARLADWCLQQTTRLAPDLIGRQQSEAVASLEQLQPQIIASLRWLHARDEANDFVDLACSLFRYWRIRGLMAEAEYWMSIAIDPRWQGALAPEKRAQALATAGWIALERGQTEMAETHAQSAIEMADAPRDSRILGQAWRVLSLVDNRHDLRQRATERMERSLGYFREAHDDDGVAGALNNLAILALDDGEWQRVIDLCQESTNAFRQMGNIHGASHSLDTMGIAQYELGRYGDAMRSTLASLTIDRSVADARGLSVTLDHVGKIARAQGDLPAAWEAHAESLTYRKQVGDPRGMLVWLQAMAHWLLAAGKAELSARILGAVEIARTANNLPLQHHESADHQAIVDGATRALGEDRYIASVAKGRWASLDDLTAEVVQSATERVNDIVSRKPSAPDGFGDHYGLTDREEEVFHLLTRRLSDKEIAEELCISARTVNRHVSNVLAKLNVRTRREAAQMGDRERIG